MFFIIYLYYKNINSINVISFQFICIIKFSAFSRLLFYIYILIVINAENLLMHIFLFIFNYENAYKISLVTPIISML